MSLPDTASRILCLLALQLALPFAAGAAGAAGTVAPTDGAAVSSADETMTVTDALGRRVTVPRSPDHVICSGPGCLRLLAYLRCLDAVVAVDDAETARPQFAGRPYALANPQLQELPAFGEFRGRDNPELIVALEPRPEVIFKTFPDTGTGPDELEKKTGIPVLVLSYGDFFGYRQDYASALRTVAAVMGREERAEEVIAFLGGTVADLGTRTAGISDHARPSCFVGGIAFRGPQGLLSTEPAYLPFLFVGADSPAFDPDKELEQQLHADLAKEQIVRWDPDVIFLDAATLQAAPELNALNQLENDPVYRQLAAVKHGEVYVVIPFKWYGQNYGSTIADAYFVGKVLYPERFADVEPVEKADRIYRFLVGDAVFDRMNEVFQGMLFRRITF